MEDATHQTAAPLGWLGFAVGSVALILTLVIFWAGPFAPQQSAGVTLGELAAEIADAAKRSVTGEAQPAPVVPVKTIDDYLRIAVGVLAGLAIALGAASFIRHERKRAAVSGIALGGLAIGIQIFAYAIMMIAGAIVLATLVYSMRDSLGDIFGG